MKKIFAILLALSLTLTTLALPAVAEENDAATSATSAAVPLETAKGGHGGGNHRNSRGPAVPDQAADSGDGRNDFSYKALFAALVKAGIIDQETCDQIMAYLKDNASAVQDNPAEENAAADSTAEAPAADAESGSTVESGEHHGKPSGNRSDKSTGQSFGRSSGKSSGGSRPGKPFDRSAAPAEKPADAENAEKPEIAQVKELLQKLVDAGILTQEQADACLSQAEPAEKPAAEPGTGTEEKAAD